MTIPRRLDALEAAVKGGACHACGYPHRAMTSHESPTDHTIGGICPECRRLLGHDGRPFGDYWHMATGDLLRATDAGTVWAADGGPIRKPDHGVKVIDKEMDDGV